MIRLIKLCGFSVITIQGCDPGEQAHPISTTLKTDILSFSVIHGDYCKSQNKPNKKEPLTITIWNWPTWFSLMITLQQTTDCTVCQFFLWYDTYTTTEYKNKFVQAPLGRVLMSEGKQRNRPSKINSNLYDTGQSVLCWCWLLARLGFLA